MESKLTRGRVIEWCATLALVALLAWASKAFTRADTQVSTIWLANGLLLGVILTADRDRRPALLVAGFLANLVVGGLIDGWRGGFLLAIFNVIEVWIGSARQRRVAEAQDLTNAQTFRRFLWFAVFLAPVSSAAALVLYVVASGGTPSWTVSVSSLISHALGIATFTPVTMALRRDDISRLVTRERIGELLLTLLLVAGVTTLVFSQDRFPLLFLVFPAMLLMSMRGGLGGTAIAVVVVVVIAVGFTVAGHGPLNLQRVLPMSQYFFVLQVFIAALLVTMFPVVVVLAENRRANQAERDSALRLKLLAEHSTDVIVLTDISGRRLYVSPSVEEIFGFTPEEFLAMTWHDMIHPDDKERVRQELARQAQTGERSTVAYRAQRSDGSEIWVEALVCTFQDEDFQRVGKVLGGAGKVNGGVDGRQGRVVTLRDATRRKRAEEALAQANTELASLVWKDALTGLSNRRRFDEAIEEEWDRCSRAGQPLSVIMLDVDHFKGFNDEHGHQQGDHRLVQVAGAIAEALYRPRDLAVRYGGEEFAVVLPHTDIDEAGLVAERIRQNVMEIDARTGTRGLGRVTVSLGVAGAAPVAHGSPGDIVKAADDALYTSKREGRNRTTLLQVSWPAERAGDMEERLDIGATGTFGRR
jgi:diguanylate cyclase (GGDEF)-like protein/PAS domain S-box-containing protein